jgi:hypothetical protein
LRIEPLLIKIRRRIQALEGSAIDDPRQLPTMGSSTPEAKSSVQGHQSLRLSSIIGSLEPIAAILGDQSQK